MSNKTCVLLNASSELPRISLPVDNIFKLEIAMEKLLGGTRWCGSFNPFSMVRSES